MGIFLREPSYNGGNGKWIVYVAIIALILGVIYGGNDFEKNKEKQSDENKVIESEKEEVGTEEVETNVVTYGHSFEANGFKITINETSSDFKYYDNEYGWNTPEEGMKYVMASFTFENTGNIDSYVSIYDFECYADNELCEQVYNLDDSDFINVNLSTGRKVSFKTYYLVPKSAKTIDLEYETNFLTDKKEEIKIQ